MRANPSSVSFPACMRHAPANDAYMRGFRLYAPQDCIVSNTPEDNAYALRQIATVMKGHTQLSTHLRFRGGAAGRRSQPAATRGR